MTLTSIIHISYNLSIICKGTALHQCARLLMRLRLCTCVSVCVHVQKCMPIDMYITSFLYNISYIITCMDNFLNFVSEIIRINTQHTHTKSIIKFIFIMSNILFICIVELKYSTEISFTRMNHHIVDHKENMLEVSCTLLIMFKRNVLPFSNSSFL